MYGKIGVLTFSFLTKIGKIMIKLSYKYLYNNTSI